MSQVELCDLTGLTERDHVTGAGTLSPSGLKGEHMTVTSPGLDTGTGYGLPARPRMMPG